MKLSLEMLNRKRIIILSGIIFTLLISTLTIYSTRVYEVRIDNKYIGLVKNKSSVQEALKEIIKNAENEYGTKINNPDQISYKSVFLVSKDKIVGDTLRNLLESCVTITSKAFAINVDGKDIAFLKDKPSADEVLNKIKAPYIQNEEDAARVDFIENVNIVEKEAPVNELKNPEDVLNNIIKQSGQIKKYTVQEGDVVSVIAEKYKLKTSEIQKANPNVNLNKISVGQVLSLTVPRYVINVRKSTYKNSEEKIPFKIEYEDTQELYKGDKKLKADGKEGRKLVNKEFVSINGILEETKIISENVLDQPKAQIILRGTKERPRTVATGIFMLPSRGSISSRFGERWGRPHTGIDIAVPKGTPNLAADGGVVTFADWENDYGKLVIIDHENGITTYYGHNDTINVKVGQRVAKGDVIGTAGTTGRVTGSNLHFEVRINGVPVDPLNYLQQ